MTDMFPGLPGRKSLLLCTLCILAISAVRLTMTFVFTNQLFRIHTQELAWNLATVSASQLTTERFDGTETPPIFADLKTLYPGAEPYILDRSGAIVYPNPAKLKQSRVDLEPLLAALSDERPELPLVATDPLTPADTALFSVAPLVRQSEAGFLYITLTNETLAALRFRNHGWRVLGELTLLMSAGFLLCLLLAPSLMGYLRRRFSQLEYILRDPLRHTIPLRRKDEVSRLWATIQQIAELSSRNLAQRAELRRERQTLLLDIVHDLRGPNSGHHAAMEIFNRDWSVLPDQTSRALIQSLRAGSATQHAYLDRLSAIELLDRPGEDVIFAPVELYVLCSQVIAREQSRAMNQGISLLLTAPASIPVVRGDRALLERLIGNLVDNALQYTPRGGTIEIRLVPGTEAIRLEIRDTGRGIADTDLTRIFMPLVRGGGARNSNTRGAGLGLAIVQKIAELHGGSVTVASRLGEGTVFTVLIPTSTEVRESPPPAHRRPLGLPSFRLAWPERYRLFAAALLLLSTTDNDVPPSLISLAVWFTTLFVSTLLGVNESVDRRIGRGAVAFQALWFALTLGSTRPEARGVFLVLAWSFIGFSVVLGWARDRDQVTRFIIPCGVAAGIVWCIPHVTHSALPLFALILGMLSGTGMLVVFRPQHRHGIVGQWLLLFIVVGTLIGGIETFAISEYWYALPRRFPVVLSERDALDITELVRERVNASLGKGSSGPAQTIALFGLLRPDFTYFLFRPPQSFVSSTPFPRFLLDKTAAPVLAHLNTLGEDPIDLGNLPVPTAAGSARTTLAKISRENPSSYLSIGFRSQLGDTYLRKVAQPFLALQVVATAFLGVLVEVCFVYFCAGHVRRFLDALQKMVQDLTERRTVSARYDTVAGSLPAFRSLQKFTEEIERADDEVRSDDHRVQSLIAAACRELMGLHSLLEAATNEVEKALLANARASRPECVHELFAVVQIQKYLIDTLFEVAKVQVADPTIDRTETAIDAAVFEAMLTVVPMGQLRHVAIDNRVTSGRCLSTDSTLFCAALQSLLHSLLAQGSPCGTITVDCHSERTLEIIFDADASSPVGESFHQMPSHARLPDLGELSARELCRVLGLTIENASSGGSGYRLRW